MATRVRCLKCSKIIECSPYDTSILLDHIRTDHPEIILPDEEMTEPNSPADLPATDDLSQHYRQRRSMEEQTIQNMGQKPMYTRKYKVHSPQVPRSPQKRRMYKTSIEKWRPAKGTIYCPKCGCNKRPIIRSRSEKMSYSSAGAACILTCWPLCFFPCLFPSPTKEYLHCAECNNFLGMYDRQSNCVRPNRDFVEDSQRRSSAAEANSMAQLSEQTLVDNPVDETSKPPPGVTFQQSTTNENPLPATNPRTSTDAQANVPMESPDKK